MAVNHDRRECRYVRRLGPSGQRLLNQGASTVLHVGPNPRIYSMPKPESNVTV